MYCWVLYVFLLRVSLFFALLSQLLVWLRLMAYPTAALMLAEWNCWICFQSKGWTSFFVGLLSPFFLSMMCPFVRRPHSTSK